MSPERDEQERLQTYSRWVSRGGVAVGVVGAAIFGWIMAGAFLSGTGAADAAPRDLCSLIPAEDASRIVPLRRTTHRTLPRSDVRNEAECEMTSGDAWMKDGGRYGRLRVQLDRHGTTRRDDGWDEARKAFNWSEEYDRGDGGTPREVPGLGEKAYEETRSEPASPPGQRGVRARAQLTVLLGKDVLTVDYTAEPSSPERAREVSVAVARTVLGGL
ncbi:hypothetical protein [Streptomyces sp. NPDC046870]|uniref:hypothetical protein n=1 Tax=Streptomyces sp. NPDC046870 TaxID=3155135 RepID=UPI003452A932